MTTQQLEGGLGEAIVEWLNGLSDPRSIVQRFPSGVFDLALAQCVLDSRNALPARSFSDVADVAAVAGVGSERIAAMFAAFPPLPDWRPNDRPALLLPVRIETWFAGDELLVRLWPDHVFADAHDPKLSRAEYDAGRLYHEPLQTVPVDETQRRDAFRRLSQALGPERAAWVARMFSEYAEPTHIPTYSGDAPLQPPRVLGLPDRFELVGYRHDALGTERPVAHVVGSPIHGDFTLLAKMGPDATGFFDASSNWVHDFADAEARGLGLRITSAMDPEVRSGYSRLIAVGLRSAPPEANQNLVARLVDHHRYTEGAAFLDYGTPTNNTEGTSSGYSASAEDPELTYDNAIRGAQVAFRAEVGPTTNAQRLAQAWGLNAQHPIFGALDRADDTSDTYAGPMQAALWPATGDYILRTLLPELIGSDNRRRLAEHFRDCVRAAGPLPTLRIGTQPYGVLPVSAIAGWEASALDHPGAPALTPGQLAFDQELHHVLQKLYAKWLAWALDPRRVPRVNAALPPAGTGDAAKTDAELVKILAMQPSSVEYRTRPILSEVFMGWVGAALKDQVFAQLANHKENDEWIVPARFRNTPGQAETYLLKCWEQAWNLHRKEQSEQWSLLASEQTDAARSALARAPLLKLLAWWNDRALNASFVRLSSDEVPELPSEYLAALSLPQATPNERPRTLLNELLQRALRLTQETGVDTELTAAVRQSIAALGELESLTAAIAPAASDRGAQPALERLFAHALDLCTHRLDAWITSLATKRLTAMRAQQPTGLCLGAYGWVENLQPRNSDAGATSDARATSDGYIHAPSQGQARAAAVLHNAFLSHQTNDLVDGVVNPFCINLSSARVRRSLRVLDGVRQGQPLGALLGYQLERGLHERGLDHHIDDLRAGFPLVAYKQEDAQDSQAAEALAARNVVDGLCLVRWCQDPQRKDIASAPTQVRERIAQLLATDAALAEEVLSLEHTLDALGDVLSFESVYQTLHGNTEKASAALDVLSAKQGTPPELDSMRIPASGRALTQRIGLLLPAAAAGATGPRAAAEPRLAAWFGSVLGDPASISASFQATGVRLNVNEASVHDLARLPGVEPDTAGRIVHARKHHGPFETLADLARAWKGVPRPVYAAELERLQRWVCTGRDPDEARTYRRIDLNRAPAEEIALLHGISPLMAKAIVEHRPHFELSKLLKLPAVCEATLTAIRPWVTTGWVRLDQLGLTAIDLFYAATAAPDNFDRLELHAEEVLLDPLHYQSRRLNINRATAAEIAALPGVSHPRARLIAKFVKDHGPLTSLDGLSADTVELLEPWVLFGHSLHEPQFYKRINLNTASIEQLRLLPGIELPWAIAIKEKRPWSSVERLTKIHGFSPALVERIRPWVTTATETQAQWSVRSAASTAADTELEQRIKYFVRAEYALTPETPIELNLWNGDLTTYSLGEAIELAQEVSRGLGSAASTLRPDFFDPPAAATLPITAADSASESTGFTVEDVVELRARVDGALTSVCRLIVGLGGVPIPGPYGSPLCDSAQPPEHQAVIAGLMEAARYGVPNAVPAGPEDPSLPRIQARTRTELAARAQRCVSRLQEIGSDPAAPCDGQIEQLVAALKQLFGDGFVVLPTFTSPHTAALADAFAQRHLKAGDQGQRIQLWLQQAAQSQPPLAALDDLQLATHLFRQSGTRATTPSLTYHVAQLPYQADRAWLALDRSERLAEADDPEDRETLLSIVTAVGGAAPLESPPSATRFAGLLLTQWTETIPTGTVDTSVALHYDAPSQQAPQALLLAVPSRRQGGAQAWTTSELIEIVRETADLAKVRAVDSDAMADLDATEDSDLQVPTSLGVGLVFPALMFPVDPNRPGWAWDGVTGSVNEMVEVLETDGRRTDIAGTLEFEAGKPAPVLKETADASVVWRIAEPGAGDTYTVQAYARGLLDSALHGAVLTGVRARATTVTDRLYVYEYAVESYPAGFVDGTFEGLLTQVDQQTLALTTADPAAVYRLQGSAVLEGHHLAQTATSVTLRVRGHLLSGSPHDDLWIDAYQILDIGGAGAPLLGTVLKTAASEPEEFYLRGADGAKLFLDGDYDRSAMRARIGGRIWVQGVVGNRAAPEGELGPANIEVASFGLIRAREDIITVEEP